MQTVTTNTIKPHCTSNKVLGVRLAMVTRHLFLYLFFPHFSLSTFSINSLHLLSFPAVLHSYSRLSRSLITRSQSSHQIFFLPRFLFPSLFWVSDSCQFFISHSFHRPAHFNLLLTSYLRWQLLTYFGQDRKTVRWPTSLVM